MSEDLRSRLARLRREPRPAGVSAPAEAQAPKDDLPVWLRHKLAGKARRAAQEAGVPEPLPTAPVTAGEPQDLQVVEATEGVFAQRVECFDAHHVHGNFRLDEVDGIAGADLAFLARDEALANLDLRRAVYLDIETTGLSGGAGTVPFMVALGTFTPDGRFELWQGFLRGPEEERAMLVDVARRVAAADSVVSFFGKSFDRHRLEDKMRLHGVAPPFEGRPHLDLYHPLARLYKPAFPDGRLATMERELCGLGRIDDLSGSFAPAAWFDFLGGRAHRLEAVFRHNKDDVLSLVTLAAHLGRTLEEERVDGCDLPGPPGVRALAVARLFADRRQPEDALAWCERARSRGVPDTRGLGLFRADQLRALGEVEEAAALYEALATVRDRVTVEALVSLAKLQEHKLRDLPAASATAERARHLSTVAYAGGPPAALRLDLEKRCTRLEGKLGG